MQRLGSEREREDRLMENGKRFRLVGTRSAECWGEEDGCGGGGTGVMEIRSRRFL